MTEKMLRNLKYYFIAGVLALFAVTALKVRFDISGDYEGIYFLKGEKGTWIEVTDDIFPEDIDRFVFGYAFTDMKRVVSNEVCAEEKKSCMNYEWNKETGRGFIKAIFADDSKLLICLSRFKGENSHSRSNGIIIGGNLPPSDSDADYSNRNETGMAFYDGSRYYHIWCNANEGIMDEGGNLIGLGKFIDSSILEKPSQELTLVSRHQLTINKENVPLEVKRYLFYEVGNTYVTLVTNITNVGATDVQFSYLYGDEPWIGNFGTSAGDVGWLKDRLVTTESEIDPRQYDYAGFYDYGNELAGEKHIYTNKANFIEWQRENPPDYAFFSNNFGKVGKAAESIPLSSHTNRVLGLVWGKLLLQPQQTFSFTIAVGMAHIDPATNLPKKPKTFLNEE